MSDNRVEFMVGNIIVRKWYQEDFIDPSDQGEPVVRPYLLKIGSNEQAFTNEAKRQDYLDWWLALNEKRTGNRAD